MFKRAIESLAAAIAAIDFTPRYRQHGPSVKNWFKLNSGSKPVAGGGKRERERRVRQMQKIAA